MGKRIVMGIHISNRVKEIPTVQQLLTDYGCNIKTRLGLHETGNSTCSSKGLLLCEMIGDESVVMELKTKLMQVEGVDVQMMVFGE